MQITTITGLLALPLLSGLAIAQNPQLLTPINAAPAAAKNWDAAERARNQTAVRSEFVRFNTNSLMQLPMAGRSPLGSFEVQLFGKSHTLDINESRVVQGYRVFEGRVRGRHGDTAIVVAPDQKTVFATLHMVDDSYVVSWANHSDIHVVHDLDDSRNHLKCGCCNPPAGFQISPATPSTGGNNNGGGTPSAAGTVIDVAIFYTNRAMASAGSRAAMQTQVVTAITKANRTNTNSNAPIEFRLVLMAGVNYAETGGTNDLGRFASRSDGIMDGVHAKRDAVGADLMHLITQPPSLQYCGVGYLMNTNSSGFASSAFAVTVRSCISGNTVAHEMGHNIACHHDPANAGGALFRHAYGFRTANNALRTTMAYRPGSRVEMWSNPAIRNSGFAMGTTNQNNTLTVTKTRAAVAGFRKAKDIEYRNVGGEITGVKGVPALTGVGITKSNTILPKITLANYANGAPGIIVMGLTPVRVPFLGGLLVPNTDFVASIRGRSNGGDIVLDASGLSTSSLRNLWIQTFWLDQAAVQGLAATPGIRMLLQ